MKDFFRWRVFFKFFKFLNFLIVTLFWNKVSDTSSLIFQVHFRIVLGFLAASKAFLFCFEFFLFFYFEGLIEGSFFFNYFFLLWLFLKQSFWYFQLDFSSSFPGSFGFFSCFKDFLYFFLIFFLNVKDFIFLFFIVLNGSSVKFGKTKRGWADFFDITSHFLRHRYGRYSLNNPPLPPPPLPPPSDSLNIKQQINSVAIPVEFSWHFVIFRTEYADCVYINALYKCCSIFLYKC